MRVKKETYDDAQRNCKIIQMLRVKL